ncbi:MAG: hypothetical protein L0Y72_15925 [Gemmataceae bacterium]|nr:hypothetical protein [Gemmataceae bacterium]MCI0740536.1 hypothetical protein [Gemmataceae bacterium]
MGVSWLDQVFGADQVAKGGVVRRNIDDVHRLCTLDDLLGEVRSRQFHLIETGEQYVVICNSGVIKIHC